MTFSADHQVLRRPEERVLPVSPRPHSVVIMSKVFLDIGAHVGETLQVAMRERWAFDRIVCFEPAPQCWADLEALADERVELCKFGLWTCDTTMALHDPGAIGASLFAAKSISVESAMVDLRDAAHWFSANISATDEVIVKVNCEGAECDLLAHLLAAGELSNIREMVVHFDVRKVDGSEGKEEPVRRALDEARVPYRAAETIFFGRNTPEKTLNWLAWLHAPRWKRPLYSVIRRIEFKARVTIYNLRHGK